MPDEGLITHTLTISVSASFLGLRRVSMLYTHLSANPAYCSPSWNRTTNISLEVRSYIHLTNRPVADRTGFEPATSAVTGQHSNQLNYLSKLHYRSLTNFYFLLLVNFCSNLSNLESNREKTLFSNSSALRLKSV